MPDDPNQNIKPQNPLDVVDAFSDETANSLSADLTQDSPNILPDSPDISQSSIKTEPPVIGQTTWTPSNLADNQKNIFEEINSNLNINNSPVQDQISIDQAPKVTDLNPPMSTDNTDVFSLPDQNVNTIPQDDFNNYSTPGETTPDQSRFVLETVAQPDTVNSDNTGSELPPLPDYLSSPVEANNYQAFAEQPLSELKPTIETMGGNPVIKSSIPNFQYTDLNQPTEPAVPQSTTLPPENNTVPGSNSKLPKILLPLLILLLLAGGVFAFFKFNLLSKIKPSGGETVATTTLTYWGLWEPSTVMEPILEDWKKIHPEIQINYQFQNKQDYRERLQSANAKGTGPDIFRYHISWVPMFTNDLDPIPATVMSQADFTNNYYSVMADNLKVGNNILGLPMEVDTLALFYNEDIFQKAGKTPPTTWNEIRPLARELTVYDETGRIKTAGIAMGSTVNVDHWSDILGLLLLQNGADPGNPTTTNANDALTYFSFFTKEDKVWDETLPSSTLAFATGKVAMYLGFSWDVFEIKNINPQLQFKVIPVPQAGDKEINWASFWVEGVNKNSKNKQAAWEFLKYLSSKEVMQKLYENQSKIRLFGEPYPRSDMAGLVAGNTMVTPFISQASHAQTWYLCSRTYDNGLNDKMIKYYQDAVNAVVKGTDAAEALKTTSTGITQLSTQYGLGATTSRSVTTAP